MGQMPWGEFEADAMYFSIGVLIYNLMIAQKHFVIQEGYQNCTIATLRWRLVQVVAWIVEHGNRVRLKIATTLEKFNHYIRMMKRMEATLSCHIERKQGLKADFYNRNEVVRPEKAILEILEAVNPALIYSGG